MKATQKRKIFLIFGLSWVAAFILAGLSVVAWLSRPSNVITLLLLICDFVALSLVSTSLTPAISGWHKKHVAKKHVKIDRP